MPATPTRWSARHWTSSRRSLTVASSTSRSRFSDVQGKRIERVNQLIKEEISRILQRELQDPRLGFVTVTDVEVTKDLRLAKVYVSILGTEAQWRTSLAALDGAKGFIHNWLRQHLSLRVTPSLVFRPDRSMAHAAHIQELLAELKSEETPARGDA
ncbi:MAG: 30S ribosome-binding factor RbfA [Candidatus Rokubacteria bacterium]|nr:30S ribosome-binding factor RbfA [Candidatus Rokubacteria bacterium]